MWAALAMKGVPHKSQVHCGMYWAVAVLSPRNSSVAEVLLVLDRPEDHLTNLSSR